VRGFFLELAQVAIHVGKPPGIDVIAWLRPMELEQRFERRVVTLGSEERLGALQECARFFDTKGVGVRRGTTGRGRTGEERPIENRENRTRPGGSQDDGDATL